MLALVLVAQLAYSAKITFFVQRSAVRTQVLLMVPGQVPAFSRSHTTAFTPNTGHTNPGTFAVHWFGVGWAQTGRMVGGLALSALQHRLGVLASASAHMTEFAAPATPVFFVMLLGTLLRRKAETVKGFAADLTEYHLMLSFTGTEETHRLWSGGYGREDTEAAH